MTLTGLPDLHPDAVGATVHGVYYTRAEYEALRQRPLMPDLPDFDQIATRLYAEGLGGSRHHGPGIDLIVEQLRQVWNARGAGLDEVIKKWTAEAEGYVTGSTLASPVGDMNRASAAVVRRILADLQALRD